VLEIVKRETIATGSRGPLTLSPSAQSGQPSRAANSSRAGEPGWGVTPASSPSSARGSVVPPSPWAHLSSGDGPASVRGAGEGPYGGRWRALHGARVTASGRATPLPFRTEGVFLNIPQRTPPGVGACPPAPQPGGDRAGKTARARSRSGGAAEGGVFPFQSVPLRMLALTPVATDPS